MNKKDTDNSICIVMPCSSYPRFEGDSAAIFLRHLASALGSKGIKVHVLAPEDSKTINDIQDHNVTIHRFKYFPRPLQRLAYGSGILPNLQAQPWLFLQIPFFLVSIFFALLLLCLKLRPHLIHAHWIIPQGFIGIIVGRMLGIPAITTAHGGDAFSLSNMLLTKIKQFTIRNSNAWTSNTNTTSFALPNNINHPPVIIPMGVDTTHFSTGDASKVPQNAEKESLVILFIGRLVKKKGVTVLLNAYAQLPPTLRSLSTLWIVGDGEERKSLEIQARNLGINDKIQFWGKLDNNLLPNYYASADVFVGPSIVDENGDTEGQGVVFLEAFAAGKPVIGTTAGGISEIVSHEDTGLLVPPNDPIQLANALSKLLSNAELRKRLGKNAALRADQYAWPNIAEHFIDLYRCALNKHRP